MNENNQSQQATESFINSMLEYNSGGISSIRILVLMWELGVFLV